MNPFELVLVMPVYNEEECILRVVRNWHDELLRLGIDFKMIVLDDGSRDATVARLAALSGNPRIEVISKENSGHGPTILKGYHMAVQQAEWVFQSDSDDEMSPNNFGALWQQRAGYSALFGCRSGREQSSGRRLISGVSRLVVRLLFGKGIVDVNTPFRLMRSSVLTQLLTRIPDNTFAPNILISGVLAASSLPVLNILVPHEGRKTGQVSMVKWRLWRAAFRSLLQTIWFRIKCIKISVN